jgi:hypothetical protein
MAMTSKTVDNRRTGLSKKEIEDIVELAVARAMKQTMQITLPEVVHVAVTRAMSNYEHECVLDLSDRELEAANTLVDVMKSAGNGDAVAGVEIIRKNHDFITKMRARLDKAGDTVTGYVLKGVMTVIFMVFSLGLAFLLFVKNGGNPPTP